LNYGFSFLLFSFSLLAFSSMISVPCQGIAHFSTYFFCCVRSGQRYNRPAKTAATQQDLSIAAAIIKPSL
jgi:hypothetical protein